MSDNKERCILLVEDNPDDEELTCRALRKNNITNPVIVAHDGAEALEILHGERSIVNGEEILPQVILLDLNLPKIGGLEVLRRLRSDPRTALLPVVVLTTSVQEQDLIDGYRLGANSYVQKPVDFDDFLAATRQLGLYWLLLNVSPPKGGR